VLSTCVVNPNHVLHHVVAGYVTVNLQSCMYMATWTPPVSNCMMFSFLQIISACYCSSAALKHFVFQAQTQHRNDAAMAVEMQRQENAAAGIPPPQFGKFE